MERYRLAELAAATGVSPRTIRYYIAEGLLPPPEGPGPAAVYTAAQRDRLALIALLKTRYLPLREIGQRLAALSDDAVRAELDHARTATASADPDAAIVVSRQSSEERARSATTPADRVTEPAPPIPSERWERITLADGVELHVRADRLRRPIPLAALIRESRRVLEEG